MTNFKFQKGQRVTVKIWGAGVIDALPYNADSDVYGVLLDKPDMIVTSHGVVPDRWKPVPEKYIKAETKVKTTNDTYQFRHSTTMPDR